MTSAPRESVLARSSRARWLLPVFLVVLIGLSIHRLTRPAAASGHAALAGTTMGTTWSVRVGRALGRDERGRLDEAIQGRLDEVDRLMSTWRGDSELSRFNAHDSTAPFPVSAALVDVFRIARETSEHTHGAFDVTVAPLVAAWGFGATDRIPAPPPETELATLLGQTGFARVEIDEDASTLRKHGPEVTCDLSAVAKGWAVDGVGELLRARGHADFLVEVGGELLAAGRRPDGRPWRVAIERPTPAEASVQAIVELADLALATSGDYREYYEADGRWLSHLIDPRTGHPIDHGLASVSVAHTSAARADALATALIVLGPDAGRELAEREGWDAYFVVREAPGVFRTFCTAAFEDLLRSPGGEREEAMGDDL